ncbi:hypothetical protein ACM66B_002562 [Microbotryomycetes sp. NB124-2]
MKASAYSQGYGPGSSAPWQQQQQQQPSSLPVPRPGTNSYGLVDINLTAQQQEQQQQQQMQQQQQLQQTPQPAVAAATDFGPGASSGSYPIAAHPGALSTHAAPGSNTPTYPYQAPYPPQGQPSAAAGLDGHAQAQPGSSSDIQTAPASAHANTSNVRPATQLVSADRKPRIPLADRDIYMMSLPSQDDPGYYDSPSSVESDDEDFPHTPADAGNLQSYLPTTNRGHKLSSSGKHIRRGRLGGYPHTDAGFEPESSAKRRKLFPGTGTDFGAPSSSSKVDRETFPIAPNFHLIPRGAEPRPAPVALPPVAQSPLDLLLTPGMQYSLGPKNQILRMLAMSATGLIEEEQPLITSLSRVCAGLRGEGFEFRWSGDEEVRQQRLKEREQEEQEERIKREARRKAEREERDRKEELERKERERRDEDERIENERRAAEKEAARAKAEAEAKAKADAAAAEAAEAAEAEAERQAEALKLEQQQQAEQIQQRQQQIEDVKTEELQIEAMAADSATDANAAKADAAKSAAADANAMDVDEPATAQQTPAETANSTTPAVTTNLEVAALPSLPDISIGDSQPTVGPVEANATLAAEPASKAASEAASTPAFTGNGTPNAVASTSDENSAVPPPSTAADGAETATQADQNEDDEAADETGGETETVRRTSRRVAKRTYGDSGAGSTSDDDAYEDAAEDRRIAAAAAKRRAGQFDEDDDAGTGSGPGSRRGDDTPPRIVEEELPEYAKRLVDPEVYVRSLFVSEDKVELPAVVPMGAAPPPPGTMDVLSPNEQEVLLHDCLTDLHRFLADTLEYRNRVAEIRDGVLGIERRRKGMWKVVRTVAADWLEEEEQAAAL